MPASAKLPESASWLLNAGADDMSRRLKAMTGTPEEIAALEAAIAHEEAKPKLSRRSSRLKPIQAKLSQLRKAAPSTLAEVTDAAPRDPAWDSARETADQIRTAGRLFLRGQVRLGMILSGLKKAHGIERGCFGKNRTPDSGDLISWPDLVLRETGYSRQSADVFIRLYESTKAKLKGSRKLSLPAPAKKDALVLFQTENPLTLTPDQWAQVDQVIASLTDGETQTSLMQELGILPKPKPMPKGGADKNPPADPEQTAGQLAFHFFDGLGSALINTRMNPDYLKLLHALPIHSTEEHQLTLTTLETEARSLLADIERIKSDAAKHTNHLRRI